MTTYCTIQSSKHTVIPPIKGSRFEGYIFPVSEIEEVKSIISKIQTIHPKATHVCYAYSIGLQIQEQIFGDLVIHSERDYANDDGEPSSTAGKPILKVLQGASLRNVGCAVVRYYGGTMLGVGGLIKAYTQTAQAVLEAATIQEIPLTHTVEISVGFESYHEFMNRREQRGYNYSQKTGSDSMTIELTIPWDDYDEFLSYCQSKELDIRD